ncbi:MAG TPA: HEAT repeat domain-containing protein [Thermoanaerobaculia bacterium]|jgi:HEAT repeat protein
MKEATEFAGALHVALKALQFYSAEHPRSAEALQQVEQSCTALLALRTRATFTSSGGTLLFDGEPLPSPSAHVRGLLGELDRRQLGGFIVLAGVTGRELLELVRLLTMRPEQIRNAGGAEELLRGAEVTHIRMSHVRYEAVADGEVVVPSASVRSDKHIAAVSDPAAALPALLQQYLLAQVPPAQPDETVEASVERAREVLRTAVASLDPLAQLTLLLRATGAADASSRGAMKAAAASILATDPLRTLVDSLAASNDQARGLRERLADLGVSREQFDELLDAVAWDKLSLDDRMQKLLEGDRIFDFPPDKLQRFIRELLEEGRHAHVQRLLERFVLGLEHDTRVVRRGVCDTLGQVVMFARQPGLSREAEHLAGSAILNHFVREKDARLRIVVAEAVANLVTALVSTGRCEAALRALTRLDHAISVAPPDAAMHAAAAELPRALSEPQRAAELIAQICAADAETLAKSVLPLVARVGGAIAPRVIEALGNEEDRNRRGRLVKALKTIGQPAFPHLVDALGAPTWFIVRNALNVLGDIGTAEHVEPIGRKLQHGDPRVRRAAARALGKIGGSEAELLLIAAMNDKDSETQAEVLLCLGAMKAHTAVTGVTELARARLLGTDEKVRELAVTTLGQIGSDAALPVLGDILKPKSFFTREPPTIRIAAAKALATISTPAAKDLLKTAINAETDRATKAALTKLVS